MTAALPATRIFVIVPAAGVGSRFGAAGAKQYAPLCGVPLVSHTLRRLLALRPAQILVVLAPDDRTWHDSMAPAGAAVAVARCGGSSRAVTVRNALEHLATAGDCRPHDFVAVHDAARACVPLDALRRLADELHAEDAGGLLAVPVSDTLKRAESALPARSAVTVDRRGLWLAQTPQMFRFALLRAALTRRDAAECTDEAEAMERAGHVPRLVMGSTANLKITHAHDVALAEAIIARDAAPSGESSGEPIHAQYR